jgi:hypothetical protein
MGLQVTDIYETAMLPVPQSFTIPQPEYREIQQVPAAQDADMTTPRLVPGPAGGTAPPNRWLSGLPDSSCPPSANRGVRGVTDELLVWLWQPPWATLLPVSSSWYKYSRQSEAGRLIGWFLDLRQAVG